MAALRELVVSLNANTTALERSISKSTVFIEKEMQKVSSSVQAMNSDFKSSARDISAALMTLNSGISGLPYALTRATSGFALLGVGAAVAVYGISKALELGIKTVDDYQVGIISIAASLTNMAKPGQGSLGEVFLRNKEEAQKMYRAMTLEATKHFATANEMMIVYNKLIQGGYATRLKEVEALGLLTDVIKLKTKGQDVERQLNTEIMALMEGQAKAGSLLAQELQQRLGPNWAQLVQKHKEAGDLLTWIASLYPGITAANQDITNTLNSQAATTKSLLEIIGIGGLQGVYQDIVDIVRSINDFLKTHEETIAGGIKRGWVAVKDIVGGVYGVLSLVLGVMKELVTHAWRFVQFWTGLSAQGPWMKMAEWLSKGADVAGGFSMAEPGGGARLGGATGSWAPEKSGPPEVQVPKMQGKEKGAGAAESAAKRLQNLMKTWEEQSAKASGDSAAALEGWYSKQKETLEQATANYKKYYDDTGEMAQAQNALDSAMYGKAGKIAEDFYKLSAKESGNQYVEIEMQGREWLNKYKGIQDMARKILEEDSAREKSLLDESTKAHLKWAASINPAKMVGNITGRKIKEEEFKFNDEYMNKVRNYYNIMESTTQSLEEQFLWKTKLLQLETKMGNAALKNYLDSPTGQRLSPDQQDDLRKLQALTNQSKKYDLEWQKIQKHTEIYSQLIQEIGGGFKTMISGIMSGNMTIMQGITGLLQTVENAFLTMIMNMVMRWAEAQIMVLAMNTAASMGLISQEAAVAGAKAYSAYANIPWIGLALGAVAAAAVMGIILAMGSSMKSSAGGDSRVMETGLRMVHKDETILGRSDAQGWRDLVSDYRSNRDGPGENGQPIQAGPAISGDVHFNFPNVRTLNQNTLDVVNEAFYKRTGKRLF